MAWEVRIVEDGRSGTIEYLENGQVCQCYWEFGGGDTLAIIWVPSSVAWDVKYPWAKDRRQEVLHRLATETQKQRAPSAEIEWDESRSCIYLKRRPGR